MALPVATPITLAVPAPASDLSDVGLYLDVSILSDADFWDEVDTDDQTKIRAAATDGTTELAVAWIVPMDRVAKTGVIRVQWNTTLASAGSDELNIYPPKAAYTSYAATDTYGAQAAASTNSNGSWPCVEDFNDISDNARNGTLTGGTVTAGDTPALLGNGTQFTKADTVHVDFGPSHDLGTGGVCTHRVICSSLGDGGILSTRFTFTEGMDLFASGSGMQLRYGTSDAGNSSVATRSTLATDGDFHVNHMTFDGSTAYFYVDGQLVGTSAYTGDITPTQNLHLGEGTSNNYGTAVSQHLVEDAAYRTADYIAYEAEQLLTNGFFWGILASDDPVQIIERGQRVRLVFAADSWATPTIDVSGVRLNYNRDIDLGTSHTLERTVIYDRYTVLDDGRLVIDCKVTGNSGSTDSDRNPMHDGFTTVTLTGPAGIATEGASSTSALSAQSVTIISAADKPVNRTASIVKPSRTYDPTDLATGAISGTMSIVAEQTDVPRPGLVRAGVDLSSLTVPGVADPYLSAHIEWSVTDTSGDPITAYSLDSLTDPVFGGTVHPYTDYRGPEFAAAIYEAGTLRVTATAYWMTSSGEVSSSASVDITERTITWDSDYWVDADTGNDSNDGLDPWGFSLAGASFNDSTGELTSAGAFSAYNHTTATAPAEPWKHYNYIYITGQGLKEIASKTSDDTIVLASGHGMATGTFSSSDGPRATCDGTASGHVRARIKAGTTCTAWPDDGGSNEALYLVPYGDGRATIGEFGTAQTEGQGLGASSTAILDYWFVSEIDMQDVKIALLASGSQAAAVISNTLLHRCRLANISPNLSPPVHTNSAQEVIGADGAYTSGNTMIGCIVDGSSTVDQNHVFTSENAVDSAGDYAAADFGFGMVGSYLANNSDNAVLDHHIYPSGFNNHRLFSLNRFGEGGDSNYNINANAGGEGDGSSDVPNKYVSFWRNEFANAFRGFDLSNVNNERIERGGTKYPFESVVATECTFHDLEQQGILYHSCNSLRVAHCEFSDIGAAHIQCEDTLGSLVVHNNVHTRETSATGAAVSLLTTWTDDDTVSRKATLRWQDDVITDNRTQPEVLRCDVTKFTSSITNGSDISNVTVYVPNDTSSGEIIYNTATSSYMTVAAFETATGLSDTFNIVVSVPANPTISNITPADNATGVLASQVVAIQFDETVKYLDGSVLIEVYQSGVVVASDRIDNGTINVSDRTQWSIGGLLVGLADGAYSIRIASGGFGSIATSLPFAGITDDTTWNFTVGASATAISRSRDRSRTRAR